ncbi:MAG: glycosyltransferase [Deltaproteobacteria bacterium]|nr:glycosyltransferase [Deltaproteobacteria bacterium]MCB9479737.1 glycosyltransferase [Deltaproteobacteria bacterium]
MSEKTEKTPETIEFRRTPVNGLVSVIIPVRDGAQHLADAINSALAQTYRRVEVIVVDNGSKDASPTIARRFEPHVRLIQEHRPGAHHARNRGLAESQGEYIQFLDHDDLLDADKIAKQVARMKIAPETDVIFGPAYIFRDPSLLDARTSPVVRPAGDYATALLGNHLLTTHSMLARRSIYERVGGFDPEMPAQEDWDWWYRVALAGGVFEYEKRTKSYYRRHPGQSTGNRNAMAHGMFLRLIKARGLWEDRTWGPAQDLALLKAHLDLHDWCVRGGDEHREANEAMIHDMAVSLGARLWDDRTHRDSELSEVEALLIPLRLAQFGIVDRTLGAEWVARSLERVDAVLRRAWPKQPQVFALDLLIRNLFTEPAYTSMHDGTILDYAKQLAARRDASELRKTLPSLYAIRRFGDLLLHGVLPMPYAIYGAGSHTKRLLSMVDVKNRMPAVIVDDNPERSGTMMNGVPIVSPSRVNGLGIHAVLVSSDEHEMMLRRRCAEVIPSNVPVFGFYAPTRQDRLIADSTDVDAA